MCRLLHTCAWRRGRLFFPQNPQKTEACQTYVTAGTASTTSTAGSTVRISQPTHDGISSTQRPAPSTQETTRNRRQSKGHVTQTNTGPGRASAPRVNPSRVAFLTDRRRCLMGGWMVLVGARVVAFVWARGWRLHVVRGQRWCF